MSGSGVVVDRMGLVLTAAHVAGRAGRGCFVILRDGSRLVGIAVAVNTQSDFAIVKIASDPGLRPATMASAGAVEQIAVLVALGHSRGYQTGRAPEMRTGHRIARPAGMVGQAGRMITNIDLVRGDSGGPLFNPAGELVAIHVMSLRDDVGSYGAHIPIDVIRPALTEVCRRFSFEPAS